MCFSEENCGHRKFTSTIAYVLVWSCAQPCLQVRGASSRSSVLKELWYGVFKCESIRHRSDCRLGFEIHQQNQYHLLAHMYKILTTCSRFLHCKKHDLYSFQVRCSSDEEASLKGVPIHSERAFSETEPGVKSSHRWICFVYASCM